jgi:hypothetical protein
VTEKRLSGIGRQVFAESRELARFAIVNTFVTHDDSTIRARVGPSNGSTDRQKIAEDEAFVYDRIDSFAIFIDPHQSTLLEFCLKKSQSTKDHESVKV